MRCPNCQTDNPNNANFCGKCGMDLRVFNSEQEKQNQAKRKRTGMIIAILVLIFILLCVISQCSRREQITRDPVKATIDAQETTTKRALPTATKTSPPPTPTIAYQEIIDYRDFGTYYEKYNDKAVKFPCKIFNINNMQQFQCRLPIDDDNNVVYVVSKAKFTNLYEGDNVIVSGYGNGQNCGTNLLGGKVCNTLVIDAVVEKVP